MKQQILNSQTPVIDPLTGFYNEEAFKDEIKRKYRSRMDNNFTVVSMNINNLKYINYHYGHAAADEIIRAAAWCTSEALGQYGKIFRVGGDEFTALLDYPPSEKIIDKLRDMISQWQEENEKTLSVSIGMITHSEAPGLPLSKLIRVAYGRMMGSKADYYIRLGKNDDNDFLYCVFQEN